MRFFDRLLGRWLPVAALTVVGAAAAAAFAYSAADRYDATAQLIVSPVSASDPTYLGLGLLRDTGGKRTAAASAAAMLRSAQVADAVRTQLGLTRSRDSLLAELDAHVAAGSDVVDVTVRDTSPVRAAQLANAFANALVSQRTASFQSQLASAIRRAQQQLLALPPNQRTIGPGAALQQRLTVLRSLQGQPDPTIRPAAQAEAPTKAAWPNRPLIVGIGAGAGLVLGLIIVAVVALVRRRPARRADTGRSVDLLAAQAVPAGPPPELLRREQEVEQRTAAVAEREQRADAHSEELERRTSELEERAEVLERRTAELESRTAAEIDAAKAREVEAREEAERAAAEREARERDAAEREAAERRAREREDAERAAREREQVEREAREQVEREAREQVEREAREQAEREAREAAEREAREREEAARRAITAPVPLPLEPALPGVPLYRAAAANGVARGHWNLVELERLVEERGSEFPDRVDEWASYLFFLRDYAEPDGSVPASFDWLIEDEFAEIV
ncbi:MAG TPA: hypothetical protein VMT74_04005 [Gaiellaceae bacterium]|nr:hypothetical protein [Gaiellaceae bacterium]